ncbi:MAG: DUF4249 domain-containing protein [Marinilabiliaceae bacterium]|nr:DUF4249 domain-containing protein [Marinilabiliaceae bacterium]
MKQIKYFSLPIIVLLLSLSHQSCIDEFDWEFESNTNSYVIDAMLVNPDTMHFVKISSANDARINPLEKFSVKLTNDKGDTVEFKDSEEIWAENSDDFDNNVLHYNGEDHYEYEKHYHFMHKLDSIYGSFRNEFDIISRNNRHRIFILPNYKLEIGRTYTLSVTIDGKECSATEKLLSPIEIKSMKYKKIKRFKSNSEGDHDYLMPIFSLVNNSNESKYFIASKGESQRLNSLYSSIIRIFSTENMNDTIKELQLSEYNYERVYYCGGDDDWYLNRTIGSRSDVRCYCFYPISKANYDYYKTIVKQIKTDGGIYSPNAATPISNFTGGKIYGQFIVTSESYIYDKAGYDLK